MAPDNGLARGRGRRQRELHQPRPYRPELRGDAQRDADWRIPGHVIAVVPTADRSKATVRVRVGFNVKDARILPEMGARVAFLADAKPSQESAPVGVTVPPEAVSGSGDQASLFVVQNGLVERRPVKLGARTAEGQIVLSGVSGGETIAVSDLDKLTDGA